MQAPTAREARLETLLSERETQLSELHDEVTRLRNYLPSQPPPSTTTPLSLPPAVSSILLSQLSVSSAGSASSGSSTVVAALTQRARLLQEENDELYELLRHSETGKLKEEVRGLRRLVQRLQSALRQSHDAMNVLSRELDKTYESYLSVAQPAPSPQLSPRAYPPSPRNNYTTPVSGNSSHGSKLPPTGPRAQKRLRLSEPNSHSFHSSHPGKSHGTNSHNHYSHNPPKRVVEGHPKRNDRDGRGGTDTNKGNRASKMDIDNERPTPSEPGRGRDRDTDREHDRDRDRDRERNRERDRDRGPKDQDHNRDRDRGPNNNNSRRGANGLGRAGGRRGDRPGGNTSFHGASNATSNNAYNANGDRTLAERMGL